MRIGLSYTAKLKRFQEVQARRKARANKRAKEQQEKENRKLMSKQRRTKHIRSLEQQLAATKDPQLKADLSRQLTKLLSQRPRKRSPRKREAT